MQVCEQKSDASGVNPDYELKINLEGPSIRYFVKKKQTFILNLYEQRDQSSSLPRDKKCNYL